MSESCHPGVSPSVELSPISLSNCALAGEHAPAAQRLVCAPCEAAPPRLVTTGGNSSPSEALKKPLSALAHVDWLAFTISPPNNCRLDWLFPQLVAVFGIAEMKQKPGRKFNGYQNTFELIGRDSSSLGLLGIGGESQRGTIHVSLNGVGCAHVPDWSNAAEWGESLVGKITRLDLAHDDFEGKAISIEKSVEWFREGGFNSGGRTPKQDQAGDWLTPGSPAGRTLYIGERGNGKFCRVYEKGKQLGDPLSPWTRFEVELKSRDRVVPWDALADPTPYLAATYPCVAFLSEEQKKIRTITKAVTVTYKSAVSNARQMVGKLVNVMMQFHGGDAFGVVNDLKREGIPGRLENYADFLPQIFDGGGNAALVN